MDFLLYFYGAIILGIAGVVFFITSLFLIKEKFGKILLGISIILLIPISFFLFSFLQENIDYWNTLSPMQKAIARNKCDKVKKIIEEGYNLNEENDYISPPTPLTYAIDKGNIKIIKLLVESGADINFVTNNNPQLNFPLGCAIFTGDTAIVNYLLEKGADVSTKVYSYPVEIAIRSYKPNSLEVIKSLVKYGADINTNNGTPLSEAMSPYNHDYDIAYYLLE